VSLVALCSGKGSPGVSTLTCVAGAVWPSQRRVVVAECDPSGNDLAVRFGLSARLGMASLILANRRSDSPVATFADHVQPLPGGLEALVGPVSADAASSLDRELAVAGPAVFPDGVDTVVDCGRILADAPGQREILNAAEHVVVVIRPDAAGLAHALWTLDVVRTIVTAGSIFPVVVGSSPFQVKEIEQALEAPLVVAIPFDEKSAAMACGSPGKPKRFARSSLVASVRRLVERILQASDPGCGVPGGTEFSHEHQALGLSDTPPLADPRFERNGSRERGVDLR